ncbi:MAG: 30S ribosomal protein S17 [Alphaproteobacteria bacterium]
MPKRILQGEIVSRSDKTVRVKVERTFKDPKYKKTVKKTKKYAAHDEQNKYQIGQIVKIEESKPWSKTKCFTVIDE